jgi:ketosteroid isomerase-like protein
MTAHRMAGEAERQGASDVMTPSDHIRTMFATFDAKDVSALAAFMTGDVRLRLGNAEPVQGKSAFVEAVSAFLAPVAGFRDEVLNVWSDGDALNAEFDVHSTRLDGGRGHPSLQRVSAPGCANPLTGPPEETLSRVVGIVLTDRLVEE